MLLSLAWKNIWRNKTRSLIILAAIALGIWGGMLASGVSYGMAEQMISTAISTRLAHIQLHHPEFSDQQDPSLTIPHADNLLDVAAAMQAVVSVSPRLVVTGMAASPKTTTGAVIQGINPGPESRISDVAQNIVEGHWFKDDIRNPAVIGTKMAQKLDINVGSRIVFTFQDVNNTITGAAFRIVGTYETVSSQYDGAHVFVKQGELRELLELSGGYHEIAILLQSSEAVNRIAQRLETQFPDVQVDTWQELAPELQYISEVMDTSLLIFMAVILFALAFGIINTMLMVVMERKRELGMLMAVGMHRKSVFQMIMLETIFLSLTGALAGMLLSMMTVTVLAREGIDLTVFSQGLRDLGISETLYPTLPWRLYPIITVMMIGTAMVSAVYPAVIALRLRPASALRNM
ncbi:MAG: ABC transporter permease [Chitinivibrionales bacterium]